MKNKLPPQCKNWIEVYEEIKNGDYLNMEWVIFPKTRKINIKSNKTLYPEPELEGNYEVEVRFAMQSALNELLEERGDKKQDYIKFSVGFFDFFSDILKGRIAYEEQAVYFAERYFDREFKNKEK